MRALTALMLATAVLVPAGPAWARSGDGDETEFVTYDVRGVYRGGNRVRVTGGNAHARRELGGRTVRFDLRRADFHVVDRNDDGYRDRRDLQPGKPVRIRAEFAKRKPKTTRRPADAVWVEGDDPGRLCAGLAGIIRLCPF